MVNGRNNGGDQQSPSDDETKVISASAADMKEYSSVACSVNDDDDVLNDDDINDEEDALSRSRSHQDTRRNNKRSSGSWCCAGIAFYLWLLVAALISSIAVGLYKYKAVLVSPAATGVASSCINPSNGALTSTATKYSVTYDPSIAALKWNPFDLQPSDLHHSSLLSPSSSPIGPNYGSTGSHINASGDDEQPVMGYIVQPDIVNGTAVFISEGDIYWTRILDESGALVKDPSAIRLTVTVGNVRTPKINPVYPYLVAFTATYQARRDVYLLDLRRTAAAGAVVSAAGGNRPAQRLTYSDSSFGVSSVTGWSADGTALTFGSMSVAVGLRDLRLYEIAVEQPQPSSAGGGSTLFQVLEARPIPLAQATEGVATTDGCLVFVRYKQSSHTARYVGGTAEQLWAYCDGETTAVPMTSDYTGTSKSPTILDVQGRKYVLFLSDRSPMEEPTGPAVFQSGKWRATTMNLWAAPLPTRAELYASETFVLQSAVQLTRVSCQFGGMALQEYALDPVTGHVLLRIGADLHHLSATEVRATLLAPRASRSVTVPPKLPIQVTSDFHEQQERLIKVGMVKDLSKMDIFETDFDSTAVLLTLRGQVWVAPVLEVDTDDILAYQGAGQNIPQRRYRVIPGAMTGGSIRVLAAVHVPLYAAAAANATATSSSGRRRSRRLALVLATDPLSPTAEHAFYMVEVQADSVNSFADLRHLPDPFVGGHVNGGSTKEGGLGSVDHNSVAVSPCGRRFAWTDTDDRICVMSMPIYVNNSTNDGAYGFQCLPRTNELGEPMAGTLSALTWSPGGRYLAVQHNALNQFSIISIVDCGDPEASGKPGTVADIQIGQISQVTPSRFNSYDMYWGKSTFDIFLSALVKSLGLPVPDDVATTLFFISDRDIISDVSSPWGARVPLPHFPSLEGHVYALPLPSKGVEGEQVEPLTGVFAGGGGMEVVAGDLDAYEEALKSAANTTSENDPRRNLKAYFTAKLSRSLKGRKLSDQEKHSVVRYLKASDNPTPSPSNKTDASPFPKDADLDLPTNDLTFARRAYRIARIPRGKYVTIVSQTQDDGSLVLIDREERSVNSVKFFSSNPFPSDVLDVSNRSGVASWGLSTCRKHLYFGSSSGKTAVVRNTAAGVAGFIKDSAWSQKQADTDSMTISVWPALEYRQMYSDGWRLMRDFFYDVKIHNVDWKAVFSRYEPLVRRCGKREDLDDVLGQMAAETSALHSFVYGGEYNTPESPPLEAASLGASVKRAPEWKGYLVTEIPERDPDFNLIDGDARYCPISDKVLRPTGQKGLKVGDVIVAVNGESVMLVPDINMMLRGTSGRSVRLEVLRLQSGDSANAETVTPESAVVVPITTVDADNLRYNAWEWKTSELAKELAKKAGFTVGYIHMQAMDRNGEDAFARAFFPDHDKEALIIDVRHNNGGNIDSWILGMLQRKAWMYWAGRAGDKRYGMLDWDEQFAFRGKVVVLVDEHTASNGEGVARGISELGLGKIIGTRTWGGGIWGSSVNSLVDGGIATAPQWGIFNDKLGWGGGVEMTGVNPDIVVDNDPRMSFDGRDFQLEKAISELKAWLKKEPVPVFQTPAGSRPDMSLQNDDCPV